MKPVHRRIPPPRAAAATAEPSAIVPAAIAGALLAGIEPLAPPAETAARLRRRLMAQIRESAVAEPGAGLPDGLQSPSSTPGAAPGTFVVRATHGDWQTVMPGVRAKLLFGDGRAETVLLDCEAGAVIGAHRHQGLEELTVLRGRVEFDGAESLAEGDFQLSVGGSRHARAVCPVPTLLLLRLDHAFGQYFVR